MMLEFVQSYLGGLEMRRNYPLKHIRLQQLDEAGFNVADFICFPPKELDPVKLREFFDRYSEPNGISLRHFHEDETRFFKCPVKYEVKDWDTVLRFCQEHNQQFYTLVNQAYPLSDSMYAGAIWLLNSLEYVVEYFEGPGSPRDIEGKSLKFFKHQVGMPLPADTPAALTRLAARFRDFIPDERPIVIEFNIYPYPVGRRQEHAIVWEWRQGILHETAEIVMALVEENYALKQENETLQRQIRTAIVEGVVKLLGRP